jgi:hypothetical protein
MTDAEAAALLADLDHIEAPPRPEGYPRSLLARLAPIVEENRRRAGLPPLARADRAAWGLAPSGEGLSVPESPRRTRAAGRSGSERTSHADGIASRLKGRLENLAGIPPGAARLMDSEGHRRGIVEVVGIALALRWVAYVEARRRDVTIRLGMWLGVTGVGTVVLSLLGRALRLPWSDPELGLGLAVCVVGYYLGATREHLAEDEGASPTAVRSARRHRAVLGLASLCLAGTAIATGVAFRPPGVGDPSVTASRIGMATGAVLAAFACLVVFFAVSVLHHLPVSPTAEGRARRSRLRVSLTRVSTRSGGMACLVYSATHVLVAFALAPTTQMQVALTVTAVLACLAARECFHEPSAYSRPVLVWNEARRRLGASGLAAAEEAVGIRRLLAGGNPSRRADLAASLHLLAVRLGELGRAEEGLACAEEAVANRRSLAGDDPARRAELASSLHVLAMRCREVGRLGPAESAVTEAFDIHRSLAEADSRYRAALADSRDLADLFRRDARRAGPLATISKAVVTCQLLTRQRRLTRTGPSSTSG